MLSFCSIRLSSHVCGPALETPLIKSCAIATSSHIRAASSASLVSVRSRSQRSATAVSHSFSSSALPSCAAMAGGTDERNPTANCCCTLVTAAASVLSTLFAFSSAAP